MKADLNRKATNATRKVKANEGEIAPATEAGLGAGASAAREPPMREKTATITAIRAIVEALDCDAAILERERERESECLSRKQRVDDEEEGSIRRERVYVER